MLNPIVYIISGPPGIGKSTVGRLLLPKKTKVLNHDDLVNKYRGSESPSEIDDLANDKANNFIMENLREGNSFGIELNLGFYHHYNLLAFISKTFPNFHIYQKLLFSEDVELCLDRASFRYELGGHLVKAEIIVSMYENTFALMKQFSKLIQSCDCIDVNDEGWRYVMKLNHHENSLYLSDELPNWFTEHFNVDIIKKSLRN